MRSVGCICTRWKWVASRRVKFLTSKLCTTSIRGFLCALEAFLGTFAALSAIKNTWRGCVGALALVFLSSRYINKTLWTREFLKWNEMTLLVCFGPDHIYWFMCQGFKVVFVADIYNETHDNTCHFCSVLPLPHVFLHHWFFNAPLPSWVKTFLLFKRFCFYCCFVETFAA